MGRPRGLESPDPTNDSAPSRPYSRMIDTAPTAAVPPSEAPRGATPPSRPPLDNPLVRGWRWLVRSHREIERTTWGRLLVSNLWPAYFFALALAVRLQVFVEMLTNPDEEALANPLRYQAEMLHSGVYIVFVSLVIFLFIVRRPVKSKHTNWQGGLVAIAGTFILNLALVPVPPNSDTTLLLVSTGIGLVGTLFTIWSLATLGRCFGVFPEARGMVRRGPYRWVRHPVYLGEIVAGFGAVLVRPQWAVLAIFVLFIALQYWRALNEERALEEAFPEYAEYRAQTGRLLPRWR
jgi:protein-S-isoprenylcysteine O-methyltransferase Ste14